MRLTLTHFAKLRESGEKIAMLTAYDASFAKLADQAGVEILLVGDSLSMVVLGFPDTTHVTMADMEHHVRAVARANGDNRLAILIPCHRVIGADGTMTGYGGGVWRKEALLELESAGVGNATLFTRPGSTVSAAPRSRSISA